MHLTYLKLCASGTSILLIALSTTDNLQFLRGVGQINKIECGSDLQLCRMSDVSVCPKYRRTEELCRAEMLKDS